MSKTKSTTSQFIKKASIFHNNKYDYKYVNYINQLKEVIIYCPIHGKFMQKPKLHLRYGCNKCAQNIRLKKIIKNKEDIFKKAKKIHNNKYNYNRYVYIRTHIKGEIICNLHGVFMQNMHDHLSGRGCPRCINKISKLENEWLNSLNIKQRYFKIKIDNNIYYVDGFDPLTNTIYEFYGDYWHGNPKKFAPHCINKSTNCTFKELYEKTLIKEQKLKDAGFKIICIWESDYKNDSNK